MGSPFLKFRSLVICFCGYLTVLIICLLIFPVLDSGNPVINAASLDLIATVLIFLVSLTFNNSSFYDPYWSIAPLPILLYWSLSVQLEAISFRQIVILTLVVIWGSRLTINWIMRWKGSKDEDWRYANFRSAFPHSYWIVSFFGIHLLPTVIVFLACLSVYPALAQGTHPIEAIDIAAIAVTLTAIMLETISDEQLRRFLKKSNGQNFLSSGLWKFSRHPNYFGEVLFWIGLSMFSYSNPTFYWWTLPGPISMVLLFQFISVPMIDRRMLKRRRGYDQYMTKTSAWILWIPKPEKKV